MKTLFKKSLLLTMLVLLVVLTLSFGVRVKAAEVASSVDFTAISAKHNLYTDSWRYSNWTVSGGANNNGAWAYVKMGGKSDNLSKYSNIYISSPVVSVETSKLDVNVISGSISKSGMSASIFVEVYSDSSLSTLIDSTSPQTVTSSAKLFTFEPNSVVSWAANSYFKVIFNCSNTSTTNGIVCLDNISIYKVEQASGDVHEHEACSRCGKCTSTSCDGTEDEKCTGHTVTISGYSYTQVNVGFTLTADLQGVTGSVAWASSDDTVATIDQNGNVNPIAVGQATISATVDGLESTKVIKIYPTANSEVTIAEAIAICELTEESNSPYSYSTVGEIISIDSEYSSSYDNISVSISDGTNSIKVYRMAGGEGLYVGQTIRVTGKLVNYSGNTPEFIAGCTYEVIVDESLNSFLTNLNTIKSYMSLAYKYAVIEKSVATKEEVVDKLERSTTGVTGTTYTSWSKKTVTSSAVYAGQSAGDNESIQLRSNNSNSGVITTTSGGKVAKVVVTWNSNTAKGRTLDIYGSNTAYSDPTELYGSSIKGEKLGSIIYGTSTELEISGDYAYIGLRSNSGAMYLTSIEITWLVDGEGSQTIQAYEDVDFRIKCGIDKGIETLADLPEGKEYTYGIKVSTDSKTKHYNSVDNPGLIDNSGDVVFAVVSLGDVLTNKTRLDVEFTVQAYVVVDGNYYYSNETKTYSVVDLVKVYYGMEDYKEQVTSLVEVLTGLGYTFE